MLDKRLELHTSAHDVLELLGGKKEDQPGTRSLPERGKDPKALRIRRNVTQLTSAEKAELVEAILKLKPYNTEFL